MRSTKYSCKEIFWKYNMISIICVYNNPELLIGNLLKGLSNQSVPYQFIGIPNISNTLFKKIPSALNYGANFAAGDYLAFIHQDVYLPNSDWLVNTEKILNDTRDLNKDLGIAGVAGVTQKGERLGHLKHIDFHYGEFVDIPKYIQCLDEQVLIVPKDVFNKVKFDERFSFHFYGHDYSLAVTEIQLRAYVIEAYVHHNTPCTNIKGNDFLGEKRKFFEKWEKLGIEIKTMVG